jgi:hypothetical protein
VFAVEMYEPATVTAEMNGSTTWTGMHVDIFNVMKVVC